MRRIKVLSKLLTLTNASDVHEIAKVLISVAPSRNVQLFALFIAERLLDLMNFILFLKNFMDFNRLQN
jgi:hypothetical protein